MPKSKNRKGHAKKAQAYSKSVKDSRKKIQNEMQQKYLQNLLLNQQSMQKQSNENNVVEVEENSDFKLD